MIQQFHSTIRFHAVSLAAFAAFLLSACLGDSASFESESLEAPLAQTSWVSCAKQGEQCAFNATRRVRYGASDRYTVKTFTDGVRCDGALFGVRSRNTSGCQYDSIPVASGAAGGSVSGVDGSMPPSAGTGATNTNHDAALQLDQSSVQAGQTLTGTVTYANTTGAAITLSTITIATRAPGATHAGGPYDDLVPSQVDKTIPAGASVTLTATRTFSASDAMGQWEAYATYQHADGVWHDGPSVFFAVTAGACVAESNQAFCARSGKTCGSVSGTDNCQKPRSAPSCGACSQGQACNSSNQCVAGPVTKGAMKIGTNFWYHSANENNWTGETSMKSGINWATAYGSGSRGLGASNVWDDTFVSELAPYSTLRFMDWGNTNHSKITSWSQRMLPTSPNNYAVYIDSSSPPNNPGMAYEWMIDLGNRTHKDIWITLPARADADYWTQLATLLKSKLDADRKVYIEYSNETWNGSFGQFQDTLDQGLAQGLPGPNKWYQGQAYAVWQSVKIFKAFQDVFGAAAMGSQVIRVFAYGGNMDTGRQALQTVYKSPTWNPYNQKIDMLAIAPYIGSGLDGASANIQSEFHHAIDERELRYDSGELGQVAFAVEDLKTFGIAQLGTYEGGQHLLKNSQSWTSNPKIYDEYTYMLDRWSQYFTLFVHYTHTGKWTNAENQSSWGAKDHTGQPLADAHKYRALLNWTNAHP
jgi:hypothetical protein